MYLHAQNILQLLKKGGIQVSGRVTSDPNKDHLKTWKNLALPESLVAACRMPWIGFLMIILLCHRLQWLS